MLMFKMKIFSAIFMIFLARASANDCPSKKANSKLICYYSKLTDVDSCKCSHVILPPDSDIKSIDRLREHLKGVKILITVNEFNQGLVNILKSSKVDGIEINLKKLDSKNDISDFISTVRSKLGADLYIVLSVPSKAETLAKFYDFKALSKNADLFILQTAFLGASKNVTFHPSRLSGLWDMQNTDSVVDLVSGLGAPLSKLVITSPVQAFRFKLQSEKHTAPGSPALEVQSLTRDELCKTMKNGGNWTLERDQDQAGPYIFSKDQWIAFDDPTSIDIKAKYARVRGLAGIALKDMSQDGGTNCESSILEAAYNGLSRQARAPRGAVLHSLEREILETPARPLDTIQVSPYRISRVIDVGGNVHVIRQDTRTEFECSRQGYFVHPRSCGRFYRCVKFDQLSDEFSVFEFDCPAGLAFDSRVEVCVWPGSLPHASPCSGSSEIAPVPRERFVCPNEPGYYADPENCRWFFACLDHGKSPLSAYEFRCPFGLVYDESRLLCEWPWLVPKCGSGYAIGSHIVYGGSGSVALDQYDGLGVLGVTALGGLHGPLQQPVAKIYSNVGTVGLSAYGQSISTGNALGQDTLLSVGHGSYSTGTIPLAINHDISYGQNGYEGSHYVTGSGGLSITAAQSLQNAGLLKSGYENGNLQGSVSGLAYTAGTAGNVGNFGLKVGQSLGSQLVYTQRQNTLLDTVQQRGSGFSATTQNSFLHGANGVTFNRGLGYTSNTGYQRGSASGAYELHTNYANNDFNLNYQTGTADSSIIDDKSAERFGANLHLVSGGASVAGQAESAEGFGANLHLVDAGHVSNSGAHLINGLAYDNSAEFGAKSQQSFVQYHGQSGTVLTDENLAQGAQVSVYDASKSALDYQGNSGSNYESGIKGHINIVGGGYSAVGVASSGVGVTNYGENSNTISHVTASPISVSTISSIPAVTSVPIPALKVASGFQSYKGGVVANVPELQYKIQKPVIYKSDFATARGQSGIANISTSFVNVVSSTASSIDVDDGYHYPKPTVSFVEQPIKTTVYQQPVIAYQKPVFVSTTQTPLVVEKVNVQPVVTSYQKPVIVSTTQTPLVVEKVQPVVTTYQKQHIQPVITEYQKPVIVSTTQTPLVVEKVNVQPVVSTGYDYPKPAVAFEETPVKTVGGSFSYQNVDVLHKNEGYVYSKPDVAFEEVPLKTVNQAAVSSFSYSEASTAKPLIVAQQVQPVVQVQPIQPVVQVQPTIQTVVQPVIKQQPAVSYSSFHQKHDSFQNYGEKSQIQVAYNVPSSTVRPIIQQAPQIYVSSTPATVIKEKVVQPAVVSSFSFSSNSEGYQYPKPSVAFEEKPSVVTYQQPAVVPTYYEKPAVSTYTYKNVVQAVANQGYAYPKPAVAFEETPASVTRLNVQKPAVVSSYSYAAKVAQPVLTSFSYTPSTVKPAVVIKQQPAVVTSYSYAAPSTVKPAVVVEQQPSLNYIPASTPQSAVVSGYSYTASSTVKPAIVAQKQVEFTGYDYPKPAVQFVEQPTYEDREPVQEVPFVAKKTYVTGGQSTSYQFNQQYNTAEVELQQKPLLVEQYQTPIVSTTVKPVITTQKQFEFTGYDYPKPSVQFIEQPAPVVTTYENRQPVQEVPFVAKKAYVTGGQSTAYQFNKQYSNTAQVQLEQKPLLVENYQAPIVSTTPSYEYGQEVTPIAIAKKVVSTTPRYEYKQQYSNFDSGYVYDKPAVRFEEKNVVVPVQVVSSTPKPIVDYSYVQSTPKPTFASVVNEVVAFKQPIIEQQPFRYYDSRLTSTAKPVIYSTALPVTVKTVTTSRPIAKYSFSSLDNQYQSVSANAKSIENYVAPIEVTTPTRDYLPVKVVTSTPAPTYVVPESNYGIKVTPSREYLPARTRVKVTTSTPTYEVPEVTVPAREYLPVKSRVKVTTTPASTYLPVDEVVSRRRPVKIVSRPKTIVKVNDFYPLLPAKLGAQCTCVSNSVKLRKNQLKIVVDDEDDGYVVDNNENGVVVENYQYEPQKIVEITPTPEVYIKSTTNEIEPSSTPTYAVRKRVRVRPATSTAIYEAPVTQAAELFVRKSITPAVTDAEIAQTVRTGYNLVKQAAKEGAREALESKKFDRYGPGGWRSKNERLQGTIDCQRAGLFRHPTQCNKFYACRWDCTKNRFTLHVFNCPVHLTFDNTLGACNWPSQGPACLENTLLPSD